MSLYNVHAVMDSSSEDDDSVDQEALPSVDMLISC